MSDSDLIARLRNAYFPQGATTSDAHAAADALAARDARIAELEAMLAAEYSAEDIIKNLEEQIAQLTARVKELETEQGDLRAQCGGMQMTIEELRAGFGGEAYTELYHQAKKYRAYLERIAQPHQCGCRPCHCFDSAETMRIEAQGLRDLAREALAP